MKLLTFLLLALAASLVHAAPPSPSCTPGKYPSNFHEGTSALGHPVSLLWCDDDRGMTTYMVSGDPTDPAQWGCLTRLPPLQMNLSWIQAAWNACVNDTPTADEQAAMDAIELKWTPRFAVFGTGPQPVVTAVPGGKQLDPSGNQYQIAGGSPCGWAKLPGTAGGGGTLRFNSVANLPDVLGRPLPAGSYALCLILYAPSNGW